MSQKRMSLKVASKNSPTLPRSLFQHLLGGFEMPSLPLSLSPSRSRLHSVTGSKDGALAVRRPPGKQTDAWTPQGPLTTRPSHRPRRPGGTGQRGG